MKYLISILLIIISCAPTKETKKLSVLEYINQEKEYYSKCQLISSYEDSLLTGSYKFYDPDGKLIFEGNYLHGKKDGSWIFYSTYNINLLYLNYKNGVLNGQAKMWYLTSKEILQFEGNFTNGSLNGEIITYYTNGRIMCKRIYENGFLKTAEAWSEYPLRPKRSEDDAHRMAMHLEIADKNYIIEQDINVNSMIRKYNKYHTR